MNDRRLFVLYWFLNFLTIYLLGALFPSSIVLGTFRLSPFEASIYAGFWLTFFVWTMWSYMLVRKVDLEPFSLRFLFFFFVNSLGVWLVARYAKYTGLGLTSFWLAFLLGIAANLLQSVSWNIFGKRLKD